LGEGVGIAAALAVQYQKPLTAIVDDQMPEIQAILQERLNAPLKLEGRPTWSCEQIQSSELLKRDTAILETFKSASIPVV
jgi:hypothetical protein